MNLSVEDAKTLNVDLEQSWVRLLLRLRKLPKGARYSVTLEVDPRLGPSWSIVSLGKIERGFRINGSEE